MATTAKTKTNKTDKHEMLKDIFAPSLPSNVVGAAKTLLAGILDLADDMADKLDFCYRTLLNQKPEPDIIEDYGELIKQHEKLQEEQQRLKEKHFNEIAKLTDKFNKEKQLVEQQRDNFRQKMEELQKQQEEIEKTTTIMVKESGWIDKNAKKAIRLISGGTIKVDAGVINGEKTCSHCRKTLPVSHFGKHRSTKSGLTYWCKKCTYKYKHWKSIEEHAKKIEDSPVSKISLDFAETWYRSLSKEEKYMALLNPNSTSLNSSDRIWSSLSKNHRLAICNMYHCGKPMVNKLYLPR